ncbi:MAG: hypothetical protein H6967_08105 [Chromatiaceae bacterium]|nr:hypothetical protein [Chromatiaceae bacterium]
MNPGIGALWDQLVQAGVVSGAVPDGSGIHPPWYVRVMLGVSGWIAALLLLVGVRDKDLRALISSGSPACGQAAC